MARWFQYPAKTEPVTVPVVAAVVAVSFFAAEVIFPRSIIYQAKAEPVVVEAAAAPVANVTSGSDVIYKTRFIYQADATPVPVPDTTVVIPTTVTENFVFPPRTIIYQSQVMPPQVTAEVITEDKWHQAWSQPVRKRSGLGTWEQRDLFWSGVTPAAAVVSPTTVTSAVVFPRSIIYQSKVAPAYTPVTAAVATTTNSSPVIFKSRFIYQSRAYVPYVPAAPQVDYVEGRGGGGVTFKKSIIYQESAEVSLTVNEIAWWRPLAEPVRRKGPHVAQQPALFAPTTTPAPAVIYKSLVEGDTGLRFQKTIIYQEQADALSPEFSISWQQPWSEPVRFKQGLPVREQRAYFGPESAIPAVTAVQPTTLTSAVVFPRSIIYQAKAAPAYTPVSTVISSVAFASQPIFKSRLIYQARAWCPQTITPETITEDKWHQAWSQPVRTRKLATAQQRAYFGPEATIPTVTAVFNTTTTSPVVFPRSVIYQSLAWCPQTIAAPTVFYRALVEGDTGLRFQKTIIYQEQADALSPDTFLLDHPWAEPVRQKSSYAAQRQFLVWSGFTPSTEVITEGKWHQAWSQPVRKKSGLGTWEQRDLFWSGHTPAAAVPNYFEGRSGGVTFQKTTIYQEAAEALLTVNEIAWWQPWAEPVRTRRLAPQPPLVWSGFTPPTEVITEDKWHQTWSQPVRVRNLAVAQQRFLAWSGHTPAAEVITEDKWHQTWSQPVRKKPGLGTWEQRDLFWSGHTPAPTPATFVATVTSQVFPPRTIIYQSKAWTPQHVLFPESQWHQPWSLPVKLKKQFPTSLQLAFTAAPALFGIPTNAPWYAPLSEPVRQKIGLTARFHPFWTYGSPPFVTPDVTLVLNATETNNASAAFYFALYNPPVRVYVSIKEIPGNAPNYTSIVETTGGASPVIVDYGQYVTEDGITSYVAEDGTTIYVQEV